MKYNTAKTLIYLLTAIIILLSSFAYAVPVKNLYTADIPVPSQSSSFKQAALQQALQQVLIKVSGNSAVIQNTQIKKAIQNPTTYIQQYGYQRVKLDDGSQSLALHVQFASYAIDQLLKSIKQPIWGKNRPLILLWLVVTKPSTNGTTQSQIINANNATTLVKLIQQDAQQRGLPAIFPILDLADLHNISISDLANTNIQAIDNASKRYGADVIVAADITENSAQSWQGNWTLLSNAQTTNWQTQSNNIDSVINQGMNNATDAIAANYALDSMDNKLSEVSVEVSGVKNYQDYNKVEKYLRQLTPVKNVEITEVAPGYIVLDVAALGGQKALQQAINLDHQLVPLTTANNNQQSIGLYYRWVS